MTEPEGPPPRDAIVPPPPATPRRRRWLWTAAAIFALAVALRLAFAAIVFGAHDAKSFAAIHTDTKEYARLGDRMLAGLPYTQGNNFAATRGLNRTPGYPMFYAAMQRLGVGVQADLRRIVWPQSILLGLGPVAAYALAGLVFRRWIPATVVGAMSALSPTGIATAAIAMPDGLYGTLFALAFAALAWLCLRPRDARLPIAALVALLGGVALAGAVWLKPAAMYWPVGAVPALLLCGWLDRRATPRWLVRAAVAIALLIGPMVLVVGAWTYRNYQVFKVPTYSIIGMKNLRYFVMPKVELEAKLGRPPTHEEFVKRTQELGKYDNDKLRRRNGSQTLPTLLKRQSVDSRKVLREHPVLTLRVMGENLLDQLDSRWKKIFDQLPRGKKNSPLRDLVRRPFLLGDAPYVTWPFYALLLSAVPLAIALDRALLRGLALCLLGYAYVVLPTATVAYEGTRLLFAGEAMSLALVVAPIVMLVERWKRPRAV